MLVSDVNTAVTIASIAEASQQDRCGSRTTLMVLAEPPHVRQYEPPRVDERRRTRRSTCTAGQIWQPTTLSSAHRRIVDIVGWRNGPTSSEWIIVGCC